MMIVHLREPQGILLHCPEILQYIPRGTVRVNSLAQEHKKNEVAPARTSTDLHCLLIISLHVIHQPSENLSVSPRIVHVQ